MQTAAWLNPTTSDAAFRLQPPGPVKNPPSEPRRGVFSAVVDPNYLEDRGDRGAVSDQRQA